MDQQHLTRMGQVHDDSVDPYGLPMFSTNMNDLTTTSPKSTNTNKASFACSSGLEMDPQNIDVLEPGLATTQPVHETSVEPYGLDMFCPNAFPWPSFKELLRNASAGVLQSDRYENNSDRFENNSAATNAFGQGSDEGNGWRVTEEVEAGYLGGEEGGAVEGGGGQDDEVSWGLESQEAEDVFSDSDFEENMEGTNDFDAPNGLDLESDDEFETIPGCTGVHLGDCGCMTGVDTMGSASDVLSEDSGSDESEDEDVVNVEEQEIYVNQSQQGVPYKKRKRASKHTKRPNCQPARVLGAIERAIRSASKRPSEYTFEPVIGMVFDSRQEAREFYNNYSWEVGFGVKYGACRC